MNSTQPKNAGMIARIWRGRTAVAMGDEYAQYLYDHGVKKLESLGARGVTMLRENKESESYFMVLSFWDTPEAMTRWAGDDPTKIRHLERDPEYLLEVPQSVQILEVCSNNWFLSDAYRAD